MPRGGWLTPLLPQAGGEIPAALRLILAAVSGAALSLSSTGLYLNVYSWFCVGSLLFSLLVALDAITGIYGVSFLVAGFNALLGWVGASKTVPASRRITWAAAAMAILLVAALAGPRLVPQARAHHFARAVQLNFPEVASYSADWFQAHAADLEEIGRFSLAPAAEKPDLLVLPETPAPFSFQDSQFAKIASTVSVRFRHPFLAGASEWKPPVDPSDSPPRARVLA